MLNEPPAIGGIERARLAGQTGDVDLVLEKGRVRAIGAVPAGTTTGPALRAGGRW